MSFHELGAYAFAEIKQESRKPDWVHLNQAAMLIACAMEILERVDDEYLFPTMEYETLADIRTDLINYSQDARDE